MPKKESELEISQRAERIREAIAYLESQKAKIERTEVVAPVGCYGVRSKIVGNAKQAIAYKMRTKKVNRLPQ